MLPRFGAISHIGLKIGQACTLGIEEIVLCKTLFTAKITKNTKIPSRFLRALRALREGVINPRLIKSPKLGRGF
jgi:hypothetical protein